jgi:hypothetical protein
MLRYNHQTIKLITKILNAYLKKKFDIKIFLFLESGRLSTGLAVPHISTPSSARLSWNGSQMYETSRSIQHLSVPSNSLRLNRYSDGNIFSPIHPNEELIDPRRISNTVRRSLLALHRESQENIYSQRTKEKTQSENDVHGAFTPWKIKMKSKLKRTHHQQNPSPQHQTRPHSHTLSIFPIRHNSNDRERRVSEYATMTHEYRFSTPPLGHSSLSISPTSRRSLKHYPKYSTQSTMESEIAQADSPIITNIYISTDSDESAKTTPKTDGQSPP